MFLCSSLVESQHHITEAAQEAMPFYTTNCQCMGYLIADNNWGNSDSHTQHYFGDDHSSLQKLSAGCAI